MVEIEKITGRLGNQMFQWAFLYALCREEQIPDTYVQNYHYFDKYRNELREIFGEGIRNINRVGIHVRRGDYVNNPFYTDFSKTDYYERAMALFPGKEFLIFSDDKEWCKTRFPNIETYSGKTELEDFNGLASCEGIIMANSSFSWWASYLSSAKVVAPKEQLWYTDCKIRCKLLNEWTQI
jgi:hypothetical protein